MYILKNAPSINRIRSRLGEGALSLPILVMLPSLTLAAFSIFGEFALYVIAMVVPIATTFAWIFFGRTSRVDNLSDKAEPLRRAALESTLDAHIAQKRFNGRNVGCVVVAIDAFQDLSERIGRRGCEPILAQIQARLCVAMRRNDVVAPIGDGEFAVVISPSLTLDLETLLQISARLQACVADPLDLDATTITVSASIGFCQCNRLDQPTGRALIEAAEAAMIEARRHGAGSIRAYSVELHRQIQTDHMLRDKLEAALENGQITPWFQPQISTDTGQVTGFEALARWIDPELGMVSPADFLPVIDKAGLMERLGDIILVDSLGALKLWDKTGFEIPRVSVNFSAIELRNPHLVDRIAWELDRFDLTPDRLAIEILESVISDTPDDIISRNISGLERMGCLIDLDDFGTGHASITSIRRFAVGRLKIDRSFVSRVDVDPEQQRMIGAILTMAERLGLHCLAEGVEKTGEHAMLSQLGCRDVQGFLLGRPMPLADTPGWLTRYAETIIPPPALKKRMG